MNMALRPFSLLLLLLVMIPVITPAELNEGKEIYPDTQCSRQDVFFCYELTTATEDDADMKRTVVPNVPNDGIKDGGIILDSRNDEYWIITFDYTFDTTFFGSDCKNIFITGTEEASIVCEDVYYGNDIPKFGINKGVRVEPWRFYKSWHILQYYLKVDPGSYVADELGLFANPEMKLAIHKKLYADILTLYHSAIAHSTSPTFKPFVCKITKDSKKPDGVAVKASQTDNTFSCAVGQTIFLEGTNTHAQMVYCGVGGWFGADKKMILKRYKNKEHPYCMKEYEQINAGGNGTINSFSGPDPSSDLESRISVLESRISGLESKISDLASSNKDLASAIKGLAPSFSDRPAPSNDTIGTHL